MKFPKREYFNRLLGVAVDGAGNLYIADNGDQAIDMWTATNATVTTLVSLSPDQTYPIAVAVDGAGNVYFTSGNQIQEWTATNGTVSELASLNQPAGLAVDSAGNVYVANGDNTIREWNSSGAITTLASSGLSPHIGIAVDGSGNVYIADNGNAAIEKWTATTGTLTTLVQSPEGISVYGIAVDGAGNVYVADENDAIDELAQAFVDPTSKTEPMAAGIDVLPVVLPAAENLTGPFAPTSDQPWLTLNGTTNGVVSYAFAANTTGADRTGHLTVLGEPIAITQAGAGGPTLTSATWLPGGSFQFSFTGTPGSSYSVLSSTNPALPFNAWTAAGAATENAPGHFQFTVTPSPANPEEFYLVRTP